MTRFGRGRQRLDRFFWRSSPCAFLFLFFFWRIFRRNIRPYKYTVQGHERACPCIVCVCVCVCVCAVHQPRAAEIPSLEILRFQHV
ncbi:hypothetical protein LY76DRAFT_421380 [Colletotrichum caudatum]|nr:hypothetical protein LY76DRAFT_421380 [Colletotrichum caudatum]